MPSATDPPPTARMPWAGIKPVPGQHPSRQNIPLRAATSAETPYARTAQIGGYTCACPTQTNYVS